MQTYTDQQIDDWLGTRGLTRDDLPTSENPADLKPGDLIWLRAARWHSPQKFVHRLSAVTEHYVEVDNDEDPEKYQYYSIDPLTLRRVQMGMAEEQQIAERLAMAAGMHCFEKDVAEIGALIRERGSSVFPAVTEALGELLAGLRQGQ